MKPILPSTSPASKASDESWPGRLILSDRELSFSRQKPRSLPISISYRIVRLAKALLGVRPVLKFMLGLAWQSHRFGHELAAELFGKELLCSILALSDEALREVIPSGGTVLDVGCGDGRWCRAAAKYASKVVGIDRSEDNLRQARQLTREPNVEYIAADVTEYPFQDPFDVALIVHVLEHIDDPDRMLQSLRRIAKTLVIEVPDFSSDALNPVRLVLGCPFSTDADHVREYTLAMLKEHLTRNSWEIEKVFHRGASIAAVACRRE